MSKDFTAANTGRLFVDSLSEATQDPEKRKPYKDRKEYTAEERRELCQSFKTRGRKGVKMPRINIAFAPETFDYIHTMSRVRGENLTEFINIVLLEHMENNKEIYQKAIEFKNSL